MLRLLIVPLLFGLAVGEELDLPNRIGVIVPAGEGDYKPRLESDLNEVLLNMARFRVVSTDDIREVLSRDYPTDCWSLNLKKLQVLRDSLKLDYLVVACLSRLESYRDSYRDTLGHLRDFAKANATAYVRIVNLEEEKTISSVTLRGTSEDTAVTSRGEAIDKAYEDCLSDIKHHLKAFFVLRGKIIEKERGLFVINVGEEIGARHKMKFQVLRRRQRVGFLEVTYLDVGKSWARALQGRSRMKPGFEVRELPFGLLFCELGPAFINASVNALPNAGYPTDSISRFNLYGLGFGAGRVWHVEGGFYYGAGEQLHVGRFDLVPSYRISLIDDHLWSHIGLAAAPGLVFQPFRAATPLFGDSSGTTSKSFITAGPRAGFKIRFGAFGIDLAGGYLFPRKLEDWVYTKTVNKERISVPLRPEWLSHPEVTIGGWEINLGLSYNFEIY